MVPLSRVWFDINKYEYTSSDPGNSSMQLGARNGHLNDIQALKLILETY